MTNKFYFSKEWRAICDQVKRRSRGMCEVPGCDRPGVVCDHIVSRRAGGADHPSNVRHLCRAHDNQVKEGASGKRRGGGVLRLKGCNPDGTPLDAGHWWNR